ncbi:MAG: VOC family protein [Bacteroidota bacterium]
MQKITPFLWFNFNAQEAVNFYQSVFKTSQILKTTYYGEGAPVPKGTIMTIDFKLNEHEFVAINGGPHYSFSPAISFVINCDTQDEIDHYWDKLSEGGTDMQCGWLTDKFGVTWQVVPSNIVELLYSPDPEKSQRAMNALFQMYKIDIKTLQQA